MSAENKPAEPEEKASEVTKDEASKKVKELGTFFLYRCKECRTLTQDPTNHSITSEHFVGYLAISIPVEAEVEVTPEIAAEEDKKKKEEATAIAGKVIAAASGAQRTRK
jgi:hypothetical protein